MMMIRKFLVCCILSFTVLLSASATDTAQTPTPAQAITEPVMPDDDLEAIMQNSALTAKTIRLNPMAVSFVQDYTTKNGKDLVGLKDKGLVYLKLIDDVLEQHGLPAELKYLAIIESRLQTSAISYAGAVGPWQLMPATARGLGLKVNKTRDERRDYTKSTHAAAKYLKYLYNEFGDWLLVIAAYNSGPGYVYNAIKKSKTRNFWELQQYLPRESRNHVKKFISTHYILEGAGGICTLTKDEATEQIGSLAGYLLNRNLTAEELRNSTTTTISGKYRAAIIAKYVNMDRTNFNRYNPDFDKIIDSDMNSYDLKLPAIAMVNFVANKYPILSESVQMILSETENNVADNVPEKEQTTAIK